jgi:hypothetical protein
VQVHRLPSLCRPRVDFVAAPVALGTVNGEELRRVKGLVDVANEMKSHANAIAFRCGSLSFFTSRSFSARAVSMFTNSGSVGCTFARCPSGLNGQLM